MKKQIITLLLLIFMIVSCAPAPFKPYTPPEIEYTPTESYEIQESLKNIAKPDKLEPIYGVIDGDSFTEVPRDQATHIILVPKEYAKVGGLVKLAKTYKEIVIEQEAIINAYIEANNVLKEMLALERQKTIMYKEMWADSENMYRQEKYEHDRDNYINRTGMYLITIGSIIALALAL